MPDAKSVREVASDMMTMLRQQEEIRRNGGLPAATEQHFVEAQGGEVKVGDTVAYSKKFLQSAGMMTGSAPRDRGVVTGFEDLGPGTKLAVIKWKYGSPDRVNVGNLVVVTAARGVPESTEKGTPTDWSHFCPACGDWDGVMSATGGAAAKCKTCGATVNTATQPPTVVASGRTESVVAAAKGALRQMKPRLLETAALGPGEFKESASSGNFAVVGSKIYCDTQALYALNRLGGELQHLGFGDFETRDRVRIGAAAVRVVASRVDGQGIGRTLTQRGFVGRPHILVGEGGEPVDAAALGALLKAQGVAEMTGVTEGRSTTPAYVVILHDDTGRALFTPAGWSTRDYGPPNKANLRKYLVAYNASISPGGANAHLGAQHKATKAAIMTNGPGSMLVAFVRADGTDSRAYEAIENPNSFGQGADPTHKNSVYFPALQRAGFHYSHSTQINKGQPDAYIHHTFKYPGKDFSVGVAQDPRTQQWQWDGHAGGSGRRQTGRGVAELEKYLRGVVQRLTVPVPGGNKFEAGPDDATKASLQAGAAAFQKRGSDRAQDRITNVKLRPLGATTSTPSISDVKNPQTKGKPGDEYEVSYKGRVIGKIKSDGRVWSATDLQGTVHSAREGWSLRNAVLQLMTGVLGDAWGHSTESVARTEGRYSSRGGGDPRWATATGATTCRRCGADIQSGAQVFYYPNTKTTYCSGDKCGKAAAREFAAAASDEQFMGGG